MRRAGNHPREDRPIDTIPTKEELLGLVQPQTRGWAEPVNLTCACVGEDARDCVLHGT